MSTKCKNETVDRLDVNHIETGQILRRCWLICWTRFKVIIIAILVVKTKFLIFDYGKLKRSLSNKSDAQKSIWPPKPEMLISSELWQRIEISTANLRFLTVHVELDRSVSKQLIVTMTDIRKWNHFRKFALISGFRCCFNHFPRHFTELVVVAICRSFEDISISGFGGHVAISGRRRRQCLSFAMVDQLLSTSRFAVRKQHTYRLSIKMSGGFFATKRKVLV